MASNSCHTSCLHGSQLEFEQFERGVEAGLDGGNRAGENLGHFLELEALVNLEHDRFALVRGESVQGASDGERELDGEDRAAAYGDFGLRGFGLDFLHIGLRLPLAEHAVSLVVRDAVQPGGEAPWIVELAEVLVGFQESVLRQVQSVVAVSRNSQQVIVDTFLPAEDEEVEALHVAPGCLANQVGIFDRPKNQISGSW